MDSKFYNSMAGVIAAMTSGLLYFLSTIYFNRVDSAFCLVSSGLFLLMAIAFAFVAINDKPTDEPVIGGEGTTP